jgi:peroxiredoxin
MFHLKEGDPAPGFSSSDQYGKAIKLSDYSGKKVIREKGVIEKIYNKVKTKEHTEQILGSFPI